MTPLEAKSVSKLLVLGVPHQVQGEKFQGSIDDQCYRDTIEQLIAVHRFDFIFEEAAGYTPSHAELFLNSSSEPIGYLDVDPPRSERAQNDLSTDTGEDMMVDLWQTPPCIARIENVTSHAAREEFWLARICEKKFRSALMICGHAHCLSFAFRLRAARYEVEKCLHYLPYDKLCRHVAKS
jgi:hypothetical protein